MIYHIIATEKEHKHTEIVPNLSLDELKAGLEIYLSRFSVLCVKVIKTQRLLDAKEQNKLLKKKF